MLGRVLRLLVLDDEDLEICGIDSHMTSVGKVSAGPAPGGRDG
jgi:hypothetical protein